MAATFKTKQLKKPSFFQRLFGKNPKENAVIEINNLLAQSQNVGDVSVEDIQQISTTYKVNLHKDYQKEFETFYRNYLTHCLEDKTVSDKESDDLSHLKLLFKINDQTAEKLHNNVAGVVYTESIKEAIANGRLSDEEKSFLDNLQKKLRLPDEIAHNLYGAQAKQLLENFLASAMSDARLSPDEERELDAIAKSLGAKVSYDEKTKTVMDKFRLLWIIENAEMPETECDLNLKPKEKCYFRSQAELNEFRKVRSPEPHDELTHIDTGQLFLTNKRLIFLGNLKQISISPSKILNFVPYKDGVQIQKGTGKNPFFLFNKDVDVFTAMLRRVIKEFD